MQLYFAANANLFTFELCVCVTNYALELEKFHVDDSFKIISFLNILLSSAELF